VKKIWSPSLYQIWCKNVDRRRNYGPKSKSKMVAVRHLGIDASSSYRTTHKVFSLDHIGLSNFTLIRCIVLKIWRFEFFGMEQAWKCQLVVSSTRRVVGKVVVYRSRNTLTSLLVNVLNNRWHKKTFHQWLRDPPDCLRGLFRPFPDLTWSSFSISSSSSSSSHNICSPSIYI